MEIWLAHEREDRKGEIRLRSFWEWIEKFLEKEEVGKFGKRKVKKKA